MARITVTGSTGNPGGGDVILIESGDDVASYGSINEVLMRYRAASGTVARHRQAVMARAAIASPNAASEGIGVSGSHEQRVASPWNIRDAHRGSMPPRIRANDRGPA